MGKKDPRIDAYIARSAPFAKPILKHLRRVVHAGCPGVEETLKWSMPAFEYKGPLCGMAAFKQHATFGFWKERLLRGDKRTLGKSTEKAMGQFGRLTSLDDLPSERALVGLVKRAAALNDAGKKVPRNTRPKPKLVVPAYFMAALKQHPQALDTFRGFSTSQRREYVDWVTEAKTEITRQRRLDTSVAWIAQGRIRNWKYVRK
ncbi:MAG TPA: YdeI/OmpD-associated family protein [Candidatus Eisenbacteria bacterium]|jgi:uncharacterized protein YdeI (YjbR/CyaY-like superfamily)